MKQNIIFTDFFDTIMFRYIHPFQVRKRWCEIVGRKYNIDSNLLYKKAMNTHCEYYEDFYRSLYNEFQDKISMVGLDEFISLSLEIETAVEIGCQYPNIKYIKKLKAWKKTGKKIYIVSDYHLPKKCFEDFLIAKGIDLNMFERIYVSNDYKLSKAKGNLYDFVVKDINSPKGDILMIGDNKVSDGINARNSGITSKVIPNYIPRMKCQLSRRWHQDFSKHALAKIIKRSYQSPFSEYSLLFFFFTKKLYETLAEKQEKSVTFLAREGHFLRRLFEDYQNLLIDSRNYIETKYLKCSRRAAMSVQLDSLLKLLTTDISYSDYLLSYGFLPSEIETIEKTTDFHSEELNNLTTEQCRMNQEAAKRYFSQFVDDGHINLVDIGWRGAMQDTISTLLHVNVSGYYLGLNDSPFDLSSRKGLLFEYDSKRKIYSKYCHILKTNIQLYEELAAAPHGSALSYRLDDNGNPYVTEIWAENEKKMYENVINQKQHELELIFSSIAVWCNNISDRQFFNKCTSTVLKSALIADKSRLNFLKSLDEGFIDNCAKQSKGLKYNARSVKVGWNIIYAPERYVRYIAKVQRVLHEKSKLLENIYLAFANFLYIYIYGSPAKVLL